MRSCRTAGNGRRFQIGGPVATRRGRVPAGQLRAAPRGERSLLSDQLIERRCDPRIEHAIAHQAAAIARDFRDRKLTGWIGQAARLVTRLKTERQQQKFAAAREQRQLEVGQNRLAFRERQVGRIAHANRFDLARARAGRPMRQVLGDRVLQVVFLAANHFVPSLANLQHRQWKRQPVGLAAFGWGRRTQLKPQEGMGRERQEIRLLADGRKRSAAEQLDGHVPIVRRQVQFDVLHEPRQVRDDEHRFVVVACARRPALCGCRDAGTRACRG